jgi:hypothetical protein
MCTLKMWISPYFNTFAGLFASGSPVCVFVGNETAYGDSTDQNGETSSLQMEMDAGLEEG